MILQIFSIRSASKKKKKLYADMEFGFRQVRTGEGGTERAKVLLEHRTASFQLAPYHGPRAEVVGGALLLGRHQVL